MLPACLLWQRHIDRRCHNLNWRNWQKLATSTEQCRVHHKKAAPIHLFRRLLFPYCGYIRYRNTFWLGPFSSIATAHRQAGEQAGGWIRARQCGSLIAAQPTIVSSSRRAQLLHSAPSPLSSFVYIVLHVAIASQPCVVAKEHNKNKYVCGGAVRRRRQRLADEAVNLTLTYPVAVSHDKGFWLCAWALFRAPVHHQQQQHQCCIY